MDSQFADAAYKETIGIAKFDIYDIYPSSTDAAVGGGVSAATGLVGGLIYLAVKDSQLKADYSVDSEAIRLHNEAFALLVKRLDESNLVQPVGSACDARTEPVATSRRIRNCRWYGSKPPTKEEVMAFAKGHGLDYALYSAHVIADNPSGEGVYMVSKWKVYDVKGEEAVSAVTRSVDTNVDRKNLSASQLRDRFLSLFNANIDKLFRAVTTGQRGTTGKTRRSS